MMHSLKSFGIALLFLLLTSLEMSTIKALFVKRPPGEDQFKYNPVKKHLQLNSTDMKLSFSNPRGYFKRKVKDISNHYMNDIIQKIDKIPTIDSEQMNRLQTIIDNFINDIRKQYEIKPKPPVDDSEEQKKIDSAIAKGNFEYVIRQFRLLPNNDNSSSKRSSILAAASFSNQIHYKSSETDNQDTTSTAASITRDNITAADVQRASELQQEYYREACNLTTEFLCTKEVLSEFKMFDNFDVYVPKFLKVTYCRDSCSCIEGKECLPTNTTMNTITILLKNSSHESQYTKKKILNYMLHTGCECRPRCHDKIKTCSSPLINAGGEDNCSCKCNETASDYHECLKYLEGEKRLQTNCYLGSTCPPLACKYGKESTMDKFLRRCPPRK